MAVGVDLNMPPPDGDEDNLPNLNEMPTDGEELQLRSMKKEVKTTFPLKSPFLNLKNKNMCTSLPDLNALVEDLQDYGVYTHEMDVDFDIEELSDSDDNVDDQESEDDDEDENAYEQHNAHQGHGVKNTTKQQRQGIYEALLADSNRGKLKKTSTRVVSQQFHITQRTVQRVWKQAKECRAQGEPVDVSSKKPKNCGRKRFQLDLSRVAAIPLHKRCTIRKLANALQVSKSLVHKWFKEGLLRRHSNSLKPLLKEANKKERLNF